MIYRADYGWQIKYIEAHEVIEHLDRGFVITKAEPEAYEYWKKVNKDNLNSLVVQ